MVVVGGELGSHFGRKPTNRSLYGQQCFNTETCLSWKMRPVLNHLLKHLLEKKNGLLTLGNVNITYVQKVNWARFLHNVFSFTPSFPSPPGIRSSFPPPEFLSSPVLCLSSLSHLPWLTPHGLKYHVRLTIPPFFVSVPKCALYSTLIYPANYLVFPPYGDLQLHESKPNSGFYFTTLHPAGWMSWTLWLIGYSWVGWASKSWTDGQTVLELIYSSA